jgi:hypothetical protein
MTNMLVELSYPRFFDAKHRTLALEELLHECVPRRLAVRMRLAPERVLISGERPDPATAGLILRGNWRSPLLGGAQPRSTGSVLLAPFVLQIQELWLSHRTLFTFGRSDRSVADFFMRNLFYGACRREHMSIASGDSILDGNTSHGSRELAETYQWIAKASLKEKLFDRRNASELILACAHVPIFEFGNALLEAGLREYRAVAASSQVAQQQVERKTAFREIRESILTLYCA